MNTKPSKAIRFLQGVRGSTLTFGKLIESLRVADEVTQVVLAKKIGISKAHLCDIEKGRRLVSAERAALFADTLGYPKEVLVALAIQDQLNKADLHLKVTVEAA